MKSVPCMFFIMLLHAGFAESFFRIGKRAGCQAGQTKCKPPQPSMWQDRHRDAGVLADNHLDDETMQATDIEHKRWSSMKQEEDANGYGASNSEMVTSDAHVPPSDDLEKSYASITRMAYQVSRLATKLLAHAVSTNDQAEVNGGKQQNDFIGYLGGQKDVHVQQDILPEADDLVTDDHRSKKFTNHGQQDHSFGPTGNRALEYADEEKQDTPTNRGHKDSWREGGKAAMVILGHKEANANKNEENAIVGLTMEGNN